MDAKPSVKILFIFTASLSRCLAHSKCFEYAKLNSGEKGWKKW